MTNVFGKKFLGAIVVMALLIGFVVKPAFSQVSVLVGKTEEQSSQLIYWYDNTFFTSTAGRFTFIQLTNASPDPVTVHIQIFQSGCLGGIIDPVTFQCEDPKDFVFRCVELDFDDFYTGFDSHVYDLDNIHTNDGFDVGDVSETKGFIVITPVNNRSQREAISWQHLFGNTYVFDEAGVYFALNAMGRDAVSFTAIPPGLPLPDDTELDGVDNGFVLIQPDVLKFNFSDFDNVVFENLDFALADIISIAFVDDYDASGSFGGYEAVRGTATLDGVIFDEFENQVSGCFATQDCFFDIGLNDAYEVGNPLLDGETRLCAGNDFEDGWVKLAVLLDDVTNEIGIVGIGGIINEISPVNALGGAKYMHVE